MILGWQSGLCKAYILAAYDHLRTETSSVQIILPTKVKIADIAVKNVQNIHQTWDFY